MSPYTPLLWMGQEWAASTPFCYFTDHPEEIGRQVTEGRRDEFRHFSAFADPSRRERIPDPQDPGTFARSKLCWDELQRPPHSQMKEFYREMLRLRPRVAGPDEHFQVQPVGERALAMRRGSGDDTVLLIVNFGDRLALSLGDLPITTTWTEGGWKLALVSELPRFGGIGSVRFEKGILLMGPGAVVLRP